MAKLIFLIGQKRQRRYGQLAFSFKGITTNNARPWCHSWHTTYNMPHPSGFMLGKSGPRHSKSLVIFDFFLFFPFTTHIPILRNRSPAVSSITQTTLLVITDKW
uniref:Uncharacterized protein n=1 Tax=Rhizophora mucronata TaxID=61149 RepID=A0A2P2NH56_RHIMU